MYVNLDLYVNPQVNYCGLMEKDLGSWFKHQHINWQLPNLNSTCTPFELGQNTVPGYMNPWNNNVSTNGTPPVFAFSGLPYNNKASHSNEPRGWFYCLPRFRQAFDPMLNSVQREKPTGQNENCIAPLPQKQFLVFDQSGDQTTLIFSSGIKAPVQNLPSWSPKIRSAFDLDKEDPVTKRETNPLSVPFLNDGYNEMNHRDDLESEMHEDTEELDALLYSDDDGDYFEDDEVTSTGHSPSSLTDYDNQEWSDESGEEVASSAGPTKRQKLLNGGYEVPSLVTASASSAKVDRCLEYEDDAESSCGESKNPVFGELGSSTGKNLGFGESVSLNGNKRSRKEKILETVSILQSIISSGKGKDKDAIVVLDEAINYLKSLKVKAEALGFRYSL